MDRRQFLARTGLFSSYALVVDGRRFLAQTDDEATSQPPPAAGPPDPPVVAAPASAGELAEPHMRRIDLAVDVLVAGGGMSGVCAALAAARNGARVLLVQDRSRLGGNASSEIRMHIVGADWHGSRSGWREGGLIEEIRLEDAVHNPHRAWELFDLTLYDLCHREENLRLLLDTSIYRVEKSGEAITRAFARCDKTETLYQVSAKIFCDCTGDSRLALEAGAAFRTGREARSEFEEPLAMEKADEFSQGSSILFTAKKHDRPMAFEAPPWARKITEQDLLFRGIPDGAYEYGFWWIELGGTRSVIHDNEELRHELLRIVLGVWDWIKNSGERKNSANWALQTVGMIPGKRESRRLEGEAIQTQQMLEEGWKERSDGVAIGGWPFDDHPPGGFDDWNQPPYYSRPIKEPYNIAFEALYSRNIPNLMMAGRNISNSHVAFSSTRVMATCACIGQAVGTAAAMCAAEDLLPAELRRKRMAALQQRLLRDDQTIRGLRNEDAEDLARDANVSAPVSQPGDPVQVIDGEVRDVPGEWQHRWGATHEGKPVTLSLIWLKAVQIDHIQITFDSGFHRELTLSASDSRSRHMVRAPQPETVRDYTLQAKTSAGRKVLAEVEGNYQRLRRHDFEPVTTREVNLTVLATHGSPEVRVFEIRCYGPKPDTVQKG
jgi:hypothetical protein